MKKVMFILVMVVAYGLSISAAPVATVSLSDENISFVADIDNDMLDNTDDDKKDKKAKKEVKKESGCCASKKAVSGCTESQEKSCAASKKSCGDKKAEKK